VRKNEDNIEGSRTALYQFLGEEGQGSTELFAIRPLSRVSFRGG
jgi:hypothetical protein